MSETPLWRLVAGKKKGPYTPAQLRPLVKDGRISPLDRFSYDGVNWRSPDGFPELFRDPVRLPTATPAAAPARVAGTAMPLPVVGPPGEIGGQPPWPPPTAATLPAESATVGQAIYWVIGFGASVVVLLPVLMIGTMLQGGRQAESAATAREVAQLKAADEPKPAGTESVQEATDREAGDRKAREREDREREARDRQAAEQRAAEEAAAAQAAAEQRAAEERAAALAAAERRARAAESWSRPAPPSGLGLPRVRRFTVRVGDVVVTHKVVPPHHIQIRCNNGLVIDSGWQLNAANEYGYDLYDVEVNQSYNKLAVFMTLRSILAAYLKGEYD